jgi:hypothetical protein
MPPRPIRLFMWGYQEHLCRSVRLFAQSVLEKLGETVEPEVFLVGVRRPGAECPHPVCLEPEDDRWRLADFADLPDAADAAFARDERRNRFFSDLRFSDAWPDTLRRMLIGDLVRERARRRDAEFGTVSFCAAAYPVAGYDVVCVLQLPAALIARFPPVATFQWEGKPAETSFLDCCIQLLLRDADLRMQQPDPGRDIQTLALPEEIILRAARRFMRTPFLGDYMNQADLFSAFDGLSLTRYETDASGGQLILAPADGRTTETLLSLANPVRLNDIRWTRKLFEMAGPGVGVLADSARILGLGRVKADHSKDAYVIDFHGHHQWEFRRGPQVLMRVRFGVPLLPLDVVPKDQFADQIRRRFSDATDEGIVELQRMLGALTARTGGSILIVAADAAAEAERLQDQGTRISPAVLDDEILGRAAALDGAILVSPDGVCHGIGVILDGLADQFCLASRGARYNSAVRYVRSGEANRLAVVVSEDRTVDVIPKLRPKMSRAALEDALTALAVATTDNFHRPRLFLDENRFYLDADQCARANAAIARIDALPRDVGEISFGTRPFTPDPEREASYLF